MGWGLTIGQGWVDNDDCLGRNPRAPGVAGVHLNSLSLLTYHLPRPRRLLARLGGYGYRCRMQEKRKEEPKEELGP